MAGRIRGGDGQGDGIAIHVRLQTGIGQAERRRGDNPGKLLHGGRVAGRIAGENGDEGRAGQAGIVGDGAGDDAGAAVEAESVGQAGSRVSQGIAGRVGGAEGETDRVAAAVGSQSRIGQADGDGSDEGIRQGAGADVAGEDDLARAYRGAMVGKRARRRQCRDFDGMQQIRGRIVGIGEAEVGGLQDVGDAMGIDGFVGAGRGLVNPGDVDGHGACGRIGIDAAIGGVDGEPGGTESVCAR